MTELLKVRGSTTLFRELIMPKADMIVANPFLFRDRLPSMFTGLDPVRSAPSWSLERGCALPSRTRILKTS